MRSNVIVSEKRARLGSFGVFDGKAEVGEKTLDDPSLRLRHQLPHVFVANSGKDVALADIQELYVNGLREDHPKGARPLSLGRRRLRHETFGVDHLRTPCPVDAGVAHQVHGGEALQGR